VVVVVRETNGAVDVVGGERRVQLRRQMGRDIGAQAVVVRLIDADRAELPVTVTTDVVLSVVATARQAQAIALDVARLVDVVEFRGIELGERALIADALGGTVERTLRCVERAGWRRTDIVVVVAVVDGIPLIAVLAEHAPLRATT